MNHGIFKVLTVKPFFNLWVAEVFSQVATNMLNFILIIVVFKLTNSNTAVSGIILSFTIPAIAFGLLAGVLVDRMDKKRVLFLANIIRCLLLIVLTVFYHNIVIIYLVSFLVTTATQFFIPAETPIIPTLVPKDLLLQANAFFGTGIYGSILVAYALTSPFFFLFGNRDIYLVLALFFGLAAFFVSFIHYDREKVQRRQIVPRMLFKDIKEAATLVARTSEVLHAILLLTFFQILILIIAAIGPGYAKQILGISVERAPILLVTPAALGMVIGAFIVGHYLSHIKRQTIANWGVFIIGISTMLLPFGSRVTSRDFVQTINTYLPRYLDINILHFMVFIMFFLGIGAAFIFVPSNTILQEKTSDEQRGKIYGFLNTLVGTLSFLPIIAVGGFADIFGVASVLTGIGVCILLIGVFRLVFL